ncbi:NlpC/P60 family protein [Fulvivirgaceae bacterium BMA10]|uniref:NlpC/P60 family protein n=1 Tax=Splendidivirga corallicola TaxID=3051826 RepID=A0ABT8KK79_9BACT|nr:NlpC/P60 family protein [Fulvivirgaceae bacterium BMA10]
MEHNEKGVCRLSIVPVRSQHSDKSELVTQLLFGDHYSILKKSKDNRWVKIRVHFDDYEGWISLKQHHQISNEYFDQINHSDYKISTDLSSTILFKKHPINILIGSILPISTNELFKVEEHLAFNGESKSLSQKRDFEYLKGVAKKFLNAPYLWGGKTPFGIDCSGFTQQVFKICGYKLKRDSGMQAEQGIAVENFDDQEPGDLAFFANDEMKVNHVGIILDEQKVIHASGFVRIDMIDKEGIFNEELNSYSHRLFSIRRILKSG